MTLRLFPRSNLIFLFIFFFTQACSPQPAPTPFRPPTIISPTQILPTVTLVPLTATPFFTPTPLPTEGPCTNDLTFQEDLTIPDGTTFSAGAAIDKQWVVQNSGTCNWSANYQLRLVSGFPLGAAETQPLFPARAGGQVTLRIIFTAPFEPGTYQSTWQALNEQGDLFGDTVYMEIIVE